MGHRALLAQWAPRAGTASVLHARCGHLRGLSAASPACRTGPGICRLCCAVFCATGGIWQSIVSITANFVDSIGAIRVLDRKEAVAIICPSQAAIKTGAT